ncbi:hypothetical protein [Brucella pituitosa]|uniref:hypothetical protein n=1 Tax=Brucella pituitosa TaxID=571256 RepID=UPI003F4AB2FB
MSFRDDFISNLPPNPDDALIALADRASEWLKAPAHDDDPINSAYIIKTLERFISRFRPEILNYVQNATPTVKDYATAIIISGGQREVDRLIDNYEKIVDEAESFGIASLDSDEKKSLHTHLENVRVIIQESLIPDRKKNALFHRLQALRSEVDSIGTKTDRFFAFAGDVSFVLGDMAEKAKPFIAEVKEILTIIRGSRARTEHVQLPHDDTLGLPSPDDTSQEVE